MWHFRPSPTPFLFAVTLTLALPAVPNSFVARERRTDDAEILSRVERGALEEVECAAYGFGHGTVPQIKALAARLRDDNGAIHTETQFVAEQLGIGLDREIGRDDADDHSAVMTDLHVMIGANVDRTFIDHQISYLQLTLNRVERDMLPAATSPVVRALLERIRPLLKIHLELARAARQHLPKIVV
jgi:putative membrane protein